jgi:uncharacterized membrane protein YccC
LPLGRLRASKLLREALRPGTLTRLVVARVGVAALVTGAIGAAMSLEHVYWSIAAAVLVLHYGLDWHRTVQRGIERLAGTWVGLLLAAAVLAAHPHGLGLVVAIMALQFATEMLVVRNYALAVVVITAMALLIASGDGSHDPAALLLARGIDTTLGCVVGIVVYALIRSRSPGMRLRTELDATLDATGAVIGHLHGRPADPAQGRVARGALARRMFALREAFDAGIAGTAAERREAEEAWPGVAAAQRLAYEALALGWVADAGDHDRQALAAEWKALREATAREAPAPVSLQSASRRETTEEDR